MPLGSVEDADGLDRSFTLVGLNSYESGMRSVRIIEGQQPQPVSGPSQVMVDEGAMVFLGWNVGENHIILVNGAESRKSRSLA